MFSNLQRKADLGFGRVFLSKCLEAFCLLIFYTERELSKWDKVEMGIFAAHNLDQQLTPTVRATGPIPSCFPLTESCDLRDTQLKQTHGELRP